MRIFDPITNASLACLFIATSCVAAEPLVGKLARPTAQQAAWQDCEVGMFICIGLETWQDKEEDTTLDTPL